METNHSRKLAAILFADIAGYTAMMQSDEAMAMSVLDKYQSTLQEYVTKYQGEVIKNYGDGSICLFSSTINALMCAKSVQLSIRKDVPLRIGLHLGDVIYKEGDIYGDAVNITSRIESMGVAGNILLSDSFYYKVKNNADLSFTSIGNFDFKNIDRSMEVYALSSDGLTIPKRSEIIKKLKGRLKRDYKKPMIASLLLIALAYFFISPDLGKIMDFFIPDVKPVKSTLAVLNFENDTGKNEYNQIGNMASDRIMYGITQNDLAMVVSGETVDEYNKIIVASVVPQNMFDMLQERFHVDEVIKGSYYLDKEELIIEATIVDLDSKKIIKAFQPIRCAVEDPLIGIKKLRETILGYLASKSDKELNLLLETHTPNYKAYLELLKAKEVEDDVIMLQHLEKAILMDSNYFEPQVLRLSSYYNLGEYIIADSLRNEMMKKSSNYDLRQKNLLNFYDALLRGDNNLIYQYFKNEYDLAPFDLMSNNSQIVLALQFINDVEAAFPMYEVIPEEGLDFANCEKCRTRLYLKIYMDIVSGNSNRAIETAQLLRQNGGKNLGRDLLIRAYVIAEKWIELEEFIQQEDITSQGKDLMKLYLNVARDCLLAGDLQNSNKYATMAKSKISVTQSNKINISRIHLLLGELEEAQRVLINYLKTNPDRLSANAFLAGIYMAKNESKNAKFYLEKLENLRGLYQYGDVDYTLAQAYIIGGNENKALDYLKASVIQGQRYSFNQFDNDYLFIPIREKEAFQELLTFWK